MRTAEEIRMYDRALKAEQSLADATALLRKCRSRIGQMQDQLAVVNQTSIAANGLLVRLEDFLYGTPSPPAEPDDGPEPCPLHPGQDNGCSDDTESLIEQLDEALCSLLHKGDELGEHSPRTHLDLFYARNKAEPAPSLVEQAIGWLEAYKSAPGVHAGDFRVNLALDLLLRAAREAGGR